ncbi:MAG: PQQ-binding-like beta-propeller repeat protein, partial [Chloroflexota bacterium]
MSRWARVSIIVILSLLAVACGEQEPVRWRFKTGREVAASPALAPDGTIYVGSHDNFFYA